MCKLTLHKERHGSGKFIFLLSQDGKMEGESASWKLIERRWDRSLPVRGRCVELGGCWTPWDFCLRGFSLSQYLPAVSCPSLQKSSYGYIKLFSFLSRECTARRREVRDPSFFMVCWPHRDSVLILTKGFHPMSKNAYVPENGDASSWGRLWETFLFFVSWRCLLNPYELRSYMGFLWAVGRGNLGTFCPFSDRRCSPTAPLPIQQRSIWCSHH